MDKIFSIFNALLFYWDKENFNSILSYFQNKKILTSITNNLFCNNCCKTLLLLIKFSPDILLNSIDSNDFSSAIYNLCNYNSIDFEFALSFFINSTSDIFEYSIYIIIKIIKKFITKELKWTNSKCCIYLLYRILILDNYELDSKIMVFFTYEEIPEMIITTIEHCPKIMFKVGTTLIVFVLRQYLKNQDIINMDVYLKVLEEYDEELYNIYDELVQDFRISSSEFNDEILNIDERIQKEFISEAENSLMFTNEKEIELLMEEYEACINHCYAVKEK